jgi:hypothetical protein
MSTQARHSERRLERVKARVEEMPDTKGDESILDGLKRTLRENPITALAVAAGIGFALGQGRATRAMIRPLFAAGLRVAVPSVLAPLAAAVLQQVISKSSHADSTSTEED